METKCHDCGYWDNEESKCSLSPFASLLGCPLRPVCPDKAYDEWLISQEDSPEEITARERYLREQRSYDGYDDYDDA